MQRRAHASFRSGESHGTIQTISRKRRRSFPTNPAYILFALAVFISALSWLLFPKQVINVEEEVVHGARKYAQQAVDAEHRVENWFHNEKGGENAAVRRVENLHVDPTKSMLSQESGWVDGERKLKKKLKELAARQKEGKDLGVPVLTRWLGDDFPAWVGEGMDKEEWERKRDARYEEMRKEEEEWQARMQAFMDQGERNIGISTA